MKNLPEELIYVLIFGAILLFQYLMKRIGPQQQRQSPQNEPDPQFDEQANPEIFSVESASNIRIGRSEAPSASSALAERRFSRRSLMGSRRQVQNAIVIAAILGPCRAFEPHDIR